MIHRVIKKIIKQNKIKYDDPIAIIKSGSRRGNTHS
jgi:hypothetical protein